ncbi:MAG TPA: hypothetical protein VFR31_10255 [Thermoanaerobaculia bacterium]|nr:hypothetical protein [Thermoanaerobaculia bacterium]
MSLYCGIDLHSNNCYLAVLDEQLQPVLGRRTPNCLETILAALAPYQEQIAAVAVESTFNWYWLVDGLMEAGYHVELVNTSAVRQYEGLKYVDDRHERAGWLACSSLASSRRVTSTPNNSAPCAIFCAAAPSWFASAPPT